MREQDLIHDWNQEGAPFDWGSCNVELNDETLRDGLQCPSVTDPVIDDKKRLLHLMVDLGIASADIGLPGAGPRARADTLALAKEIASAGLDLEDEYREEGLKVAPARLVYTSRRRSRFGAPSARRKI